MAIVIVGEIDLKTGSRASEREFGDSVLVVSCIAGVVARQCLQVLTTIAFVLCHCFWSLAFNGIFISGPPPRRLWWQSMRVLERCRHNGARTNEKAYVRKHIACSMLYVGNGAHTLPFWLCLFTAKSTSPTTENWLRKLCTYSMNNNTSDEDKHDTKLHQQQVHEHLHAQVAQPVSTALRARSFDTPLDVCVTCTSWLNVFLSLMPSA